jgi:hypothetical protein
VCTAKVALPTPAMPLITAVRDSVARTSEPSSPTPSNRAISSDRPVNPAVGSGSEPRAVTTDPAAGANTACQASCHQQARSTDRSSARTRAKERS